MEKLEVINWTLPSKIKSITFLCGPTQTEATSTDFFIGGHCADDFHPNDHVMSVECPACGSSHDLEWK